MSMGLEQFHETFFEESFEALDGMEAALLTFDVGAPDAESINTVFRVAHSIKGGAGMFGFDAVTEFTHVLETLLDLLRSGKVAVTGQISNHLLASVDVLRELLSATRNGQAQDSERVAELRQQLESASAGGGAAPAAQAAASAVPGDATRSSGAPRWRIAVQPKPELLVRGNDPLRIFAELAELGELEVRAKAGRIPVLSELDPEHCMLSWELTLTGDATRVELDQVFEWIVDDCDIGIERLGEPGHAQAEDSPPPGADPVAPPEPADARPEPSAGKPAARKPSRGDSGSIRVNIEKVDELLNFVGEIVITQSMLTRLGDEIEGTAGDRLKGALAQLERNVRELQESVMRIRMLPISSVFSRFPRLVRDLSQRLNKKIDLRMTGEQTELDKTVLEKIGDPLVHLIRNSIDHGIEMPADRERAGKPAAGTVRLNAFHKGGAITIEVIDDGKGLDRNGILEKARKRELIGAGDVLSDKQICDLIFRPGFSTAREATDLSGRGVGMDVVRRNIHELGGTIEIRSAPGQGTHTSISLPLTLAIVDGQSVAVGQETYIVPLTAIVESLQPVEGEASRLAGGQEVFPFRGSFLPVVRMHEIFDVDTRTTQLHEGLVMVVEGDGRHAALFVDDLLGQQQVVIKSMESNYRRIEGISGATILGDGSVALILDIPGLIRVAADRNSVGRAA